MPSCRSRTVASVALSSLILLAGKAAATTFVQVPDPGLAGAAAVVVEGTVSSREASRGSDRPATEYAIQVERVLQGALSDSAINVRIPGGAVAGQGGLAVWGAPSFRQGERVLLFLVPSGDGGYQMLDLVLGAFHQVKWAGRSLAVRDLSQAAELVPSAGGQPRLRAAVEQPRDWKGFTAWIAARAKGARQEMKDAAAYRVELAPADLAQVTAQAASRQQEPGLLAPARADVQWFANLGGDPALTGVAADVLAGFLEAPALHAAVARPLGYGGTTGALGGFERFDGRNAVVFRDPGDPADLPAFRCGSGGLVSLSGSWFDRDRRVQGGSVVLAAGVSCLFGGGAGAGLAAVLDHDLP